MKALLIAEKPSLMREIKNVYDQITYPDTIKFKSFAGHVIGLKNPRDYGVVNGVDWANKHWNEDMIPMIPDKFLYQVSADKRVMYKELTDEIKYGNYDYIINACDPDREGNHIFQLFYDFAKCTLPIKRFWTNDLSFGNIENALRNLRYEGDGKKPDLKHLTEAAVLRAWSDWLFGMNFTIGVSLKMHTTVKIGRVKTATHMLLAQREDDIRNFVPKTTYELETLYKEGFSGVLFDEEGNVRFEKKSDADDILKELGQTAVVKSMTTKKESTAAPQLYKLSDLQTDASKAYGYNADKVLEIVQSLYEQKYLSYPRTDCRHIGTELTKEFPKLLASIATVPELVPYVKTVGKKEMDAVAKNKKYVNDAELAKSGHYALSPTTVKPNLSKLSKDEKNILLMVYKRFLAIFLPPMVCNKTTLITDNNNHLFKTNGKELLSKGYTEIYGTNNVDNLLPPLKKGDIVNVDKFELKDKTTTPPPRYTQGTLIAAMENPAKFLEDDSLKSVIKEKQGIGTPATRSTIIENLLTDKYVEERKGKGKAALLYVTDLGMSIYKNLKGEDFASVDMTGIWEKKLSDVAEGTLPFDQYETELKAYVNDRVKHIKNLNLSTYRSGGLKSGGTVIGKCPACGNDFMEGKNGYYCSNQDCKCGISKILLGSSISKTEIKKLLDGKETKEFSFTKKDGTTFKSKLHFEKEELKFGSGKTKKESDVLCPECGSNIIDTGKYFICKNYKNPCNFCLPHELQGAKFTLADIEKLIDGEEVEKTFTWKSGKTSKNKVMLVENNGRYSYKIIFEK